MPPSTIEQRIVPLVVTSGAELHPIDFNEPLSGARMKGFPLLHLLDTLERKNPSLVDQWRNSLPNAHRELTERRSVTSVSWLPIEYYFHCAAFAAQALHGSSDPRLGTRIGHETASADIGAFFRFVLAMASPATVLNLSGRFWKSYFDVSTLRVTSTTPGQSVAEIEGWPLRDTVSLYEMAGSLIAWLEASRARDVRVTRLELLAPGHLVVGCSWS